MTKHGKWLKHLPLLDKTSTVQFQYKQYCNFHIYITKLKYVSFNSSEKNTFGTLTSDFD